MIKPINPDDIPAMKAAYIPDWIVEEVNKLIARNFSSGSAMVKQNEIIDAARCSERNGFEFDTADEFRNIMFAKGYLNIEEIYRAAGWKVSYDKPGYNESYDAYFVFSKK